MHMNHSDPEKLEIKFTIAEAAAGLYSKNDGLFTLRQITEKTEIPVSEIVGLFPGKKEILEFYYESILIRYRLMSEDIEHFDQLLLAEKISNFVFTSFDIMSEQLKFIEMSFDKLILCPGATKGFKRGIENLFNDIFTRDDRISTTGSILSNNALYTILRQKYLFLVRFWLHDRSDGKEVSMELTDKYTTFLQELMYSKTIDKGFDLAKFIFTNNIFRPDLEFLKDFFPNVEIRD